MRRSILRLTFLALALSVVTSVTAFSQAAPQSKGVFEPVSFAEDIDLLDVFFVNTNTGWAAGDKGTIIHTKNGGAAWTAQVGGDPGSRERKVRLIHFVDEHTGWAVQGTSGTVEKLLHTRDGENWEDIGTPPRGVTDIAFTSRMVGFAAAKPQEIAQYANVIYRTSDGGRTWKPSWTCSAKVALSGLNRTLGCNIVHFNFVTPMIGYAAAQNNCWGQGCGPPPLIVKTSDGGMTWEAVVGPGVIDQDKVTSIFFANAGTGFARLGSGKLHMTADGGATWRGIVASPGKSMKFADPGVGWAVEVGRTDPTIAFTTDGGARWTSRSIRFPAPVRAFSFPRRDRAYFVGDNGLVFRYSVVPASRSLGANDLLAPAMPGFDTALETQVAQLEQAVSEIRASLGSAPAVSTSSAANGAAGSAPDAAASDVSSEPLTAPLAPASAFAASCCNKSFSRLEVVLGALSKTLPEFIGKYKNLNLLLAAVRMGAELPDEYRAVKGGLSAFRKASDKESATAALASVSTALSAFKQTTAVSMQKSLPTPGGE